MANRVSGEVAVTALVRRLRAIAPLVTNGVVDGAPMTMLATLGAAVREAGTAAGFWLLVTAVSGAMPRIDEFLRFRRLVELAEPGLEHFAALAGAIGPASTNEFIGRTFEIIEDQVFVDVDFSARFGHNTGIQRVVRETSKRWARDRHPRFIAWTGDGELPRDISDAERIRVIEWTSALKHDRPAADSSRDDITTLVVPWRSTLILPEVADARLYERLACLAEFSGNRVVMVGHDMIPMTSADDVIPSETDRFVGYLSIVKKARLVATVSESTAREFRGFNLAISGQGLVGPDIVAVPLPVDVPTPESDSTLVPRTSVAPQVLCVGSQEPRKNQIAVLAAAEILWQQGRSFDLLFVGGNAGVLSIEFDDEVDRLRRKGRSITVLHHVSDAILHRAYVESRFSILVSKHEGFGLPIGESLAVGTPVITSSHGSMAEIAAGGGCLTVDARDDVAIAVAMGQLLDDDALLARLRVEALARPPRTWDDYARELWAIATSEAPR